MDYSELNDVLSSSSSSDVGAAFAVLGVFFMFILFIVLLIAVFKIISRWVFFKKCGEDGWKSLIPFYNDYVDTLRLSRRILPDLPHHTLTYMVDYYGIKTQHHRALSDCLATHELLLKLAETVYDKKIDMEDIAKKKPCDLRTLKCEDVVVNESNFFFEKT